MERDMERGPRIVPVQEGEEYDVVIEAVGEKGDGIAKVKNFVLFVPGTKKEAVYEICSKYKDEKVIFTDDKIKFFEDIDLARVPNLQNILYSV
jgi:predicted RNA-binding protein with TRAM domain